MSTAIRESTVPMLLVCLPPKLSWVSVHLCHIIILQNDMDCRFH